MIPEPLHHIYLGDIGDMMTAVGGCITAGLAVVVLPEDGADFSHHLYIYNPETLTGLGL